MTMFESAVHALKPIAGGVLERALNQLLSLDQDSRNALLELEGRCIQMYLTSPPLAIQVQVSNQRLCVGPVANDRAPDLAVRASPQAVINPLLTRLMGKQTPQPLAQGGVHVSGDVALAQRLQRLVAQFDPDWQRPWTSVLGDVVGVLAAKQWHAALFQTRRHAIACVRQVASYLTDESRVMVSASEYQAFAEAVDQLNHDLDRCIAQCRQRDELKDQL